MLLQGKKVLIVGVLDRKSIAYAIAEQAQQAGAEILLTSFGRVMSITQMTAKRLDPVPDILELDATKPEQVEAVCKEVEKRWGRLDGLVHSIAGAPNDALGGNFLHTPFESAAVAFHIGAFSLKTLAVGMLPVMREYGGSIITLDFDNSTQAWPKYDWMGVSKSALESIVRYLARDLGRYGIRVNALAAGPLATLAASAIPGFRDFEDLWHRRGALGWGVQGTAAAGTNASPPLSARAARTDTGVVNDDRGAFAH